MQKRLNMDKALKEKIFIRTISKFYQCARQEALDEAIEEVKKEINYIREFYKKENTDHNLLDFSILRFSKLLSILQELKKK